MAITQLDSENADRDLTSLVTVLTNTPDEDNPTLCQGYVVLGDGSKNLDGNGGSFEQVITIGGQTVQPSPRTIAFSTAVRSAFWTATFPVPANTEVVIQVKSPNGADTSVDVTAYLFSIPSEAIIADVVWDEVLTGATHNEPSSAGRRLRQLEDATVLAEGTAQAGTAGTITLEDGSSIKDIFYEHALLVITSGTGAGQARSIDEYDGDTLVATTVPDWVTNPAADSKYTVYAFGEVHIMENGIHAGAINETAIATGAITAAKIAENAIGTSELDVSGILASVVESEGSITIQQAFQILIAALAGVTTSTGKVLKTPNGSATRITMTIDTTNNERDTVTLSF